MQTTVQYPGATYVTSPFSSTLQTDSLDDDHVTFLLTPLPDGNTVATSWYCPIAIADSTVVALRTTPVTGSLTYTSHVATFRPSSVITVIVVVPPETPLIVAVKLSPSTVATLVSEDDHKTFELVGPDGLNNNWTVPVLPLSIVSDDGLIVTSPTGVVTYITHVSDLITPLIFCDTLRWTIPAATPLTVNILPSSDCDTSIKSYVGTTPDASGWLVTVYVICSFVGLLVTSAVISIVLPILTVVETVLNPNPSITVIL